MENAVRIGPVRWGFAATAAAAVLLATACSSTPAATSSANSSASPSASSAPSVSPAVQQAAQAALTRPSHISLTVPLPGRPPAGKSIYFVQCPVPECALIGQYLSEGARVLGWSLHKVVVTAQSPEALAAAWQQVADAHPDGVISNGAPVAAIARPLAQLKQEGVPVTEFATPDPPGRGLTASFLSKAYVQDRGRTMAGLIAADSHGTANVAFFAAPAYPIDPPEVQAFQRYFPAVCPGCALAVQDVAATAIGTTLPAQVTAYVRSHPKLTYIYASFDSMLIGVPQALKEAGLAGQVKLMSDDPSPVNVAYIKNGQEYGSVAYPTGEVTYRCLDFLARTFEHVSTRPDTSTPFAMFVLTRKALTGALPANGRFDSVPGYAAQYEKLWHVG